MDRGAADYGRMLFDSEMMKSYIIAVFVCLLPLQAFSQTEDRDGIIRQINEYSAGIRSLECGFVQTRSLKILDDKMVSEGKMYCQQPDKLRWEYTSPYSSAFILNGNAVLLKNADGTSGTGAGGNRMYREMAGFILDCISGSYLLDGKSFDVSVSESPDEWVLTMIPLKNGMKQMWTQLVLHFDRIGKTVSMIEMYEQTGDMTVISFRNVRLNGDIDPAVFNIE